MPIESERLQLQPVPVFPLGTSECYSDSGHVSPDQSSALQEEQSEAGHATVRNPSPHVEPSETNLVSKDSNVRLCAGEIAGSVKGGPGKDEDLSLLVIRTHFKILGMVACTCNSSPGEAERGR